MRIISGSAGGIPIQVPKSLLRPTADRVREAVFSMLREVVEGAVVLDLFAGSGSYGLECLSRGAGSCQFVESDRASGPVIRGNLQKAGLSGGEVAVAPVESWLKNRRGVRGWERAGATEEAAAEGATAEGPAAGAGEGEFNLIFADPPFVKQKGDRDWDGVLLESLDLRRLLAPKGFFVLESFARTAQAPPPESPWRLAVERRYGDVMVRIFSLSFPPSPFSIPSDAPPAGSPDL